jgi:hypothetical protein
VLLGRVVGCIGEHDAGFWKKDALISITPIGKPMENRAADGVLTLMPYEQDCSHQGNRNHQYESQQPLDSPQPAHSTS